ncbi:Polyketide synthase PksJ [Symbiodinium microadriaticum]|uniref:Polyketide synthase PksJ n=1 Tax=Symbiodinium microadriaticum TaxID=2951 RepID=A0A1Q9DYC3_SYMMI|nr:Polyketide synthase PksJ [Symbiodinium microadriaticum]
MSRERSAKSAAQISPGLRGESFNCNLRLESIVGPEEPGRGLLAYRSGDLARRQSGGLLTFAGRGDELVKVFGKWVDLADIARKLADMPGVLEAAAVSQGSDVHSALLGEPLPRNGETRKVDRRRLLELLQSGAADAESLAPAGTSLERQDDVEHEEAPLLRVVEEAIDTLIDTHQIVFSATAAADKIIITVDPTTIAAR